MNAAIEAITREDARGLDPRMFVVNHAAGERLAPEIQRRLDPVDAGSYGCWVLSKEKATELHYHDCDEYWAWVGGRSVVTIRLPDGQRGEFEVGPGWIVYCARGVEHGHRPLDDWVCYEWRSVRRAGARGGHLRREI
jgi:mannose-6-phosphate isomerase-like protein (cupin superfamily)